MKKILIVLLALLFVIPALSASAQIRRSDTNITIDLQDLDDSTRNAVMKKMKEKETSGKGLIESVKDVDPNAVQVWADVVTKTIKTICRDLSIEANEFIKTPVGMIVAGTIVYKVVGKDLVKKAFNTLFGILGWMSTMIIVYFVAKRFIIPRKIKSTKEYFEGDKKITETSYKFIKPYDFKSDDARTIAVSFMAGTAIVSTFVTILVVLL